MIDGDAVSEEVWEEYSSDGDDVDIGGGGGTSHKPSTTPVDGGVDDDVLSPPPPPPPPLPQEPQQQQQQQEQQQPRRTSQSTLQPSATDSFVIADDDEGGSGSGGTTEGRVSGSSSPAAAVEEQAAPPPPPPPPPQDEAESQVDEEVVEERGKRGIEVEEEDDDDDDVVLVEKPAPASSRSSDTSPLTLPSTPPADSAASSAAASAAPPPPPPPPPPEEAKAADVAASSDGGRGDGSRSSRDKEAEAEVEARIEVEGGSNSDGDGGGGGGCEAVVSWSRWGETSGKVTVAVGEVTLPPLQALDRGGGSELEWLRGREVEARVWFGETDVMLPDNYRSAGVCILGSPQAGGGGGGGSERLAFNATLSMDQDIDEILRLELHLLDPALSPSASSASDHHSPSRRSAGRQQQQRSSRSGGASPRRYGQLLAACETDIEHEPDTIEGRRLPVTFHKLSPPPPPPPSVPPPPPEAEVEAEVEQQAAPPPPPPPPPPEVAEAPPPPPAVQEEVPLAAAAEQVAEASAAAAARIAEDAEAAVEADTDTDSAVHEEEAAAAVASPQSSEYSSDSDEAAPEEFIDDDAAAVLRCRVVREAPAGLEVSFEGAAGLSLPLPASADGDAVCDGRLVCVAVSCAASAACPDGPLRADGRRRVAAAGVLRREASGCRLRCVAAAQGMQLDVDAGDAADGGGRAQQQLHLCVSLHLCDARHTEDSLAKALAEGGADPAAQLDSFLRSSSEAGDSGFPALWTGTRDVRRRRGGGGGDDAPRFCVRLLPAAAFSGGGAVRLPASRAAEEEAERRVKEEEKRAQDAFLRAKREEEEARKEDEKAGRRISFVVGWADCGGGGGGSGTLADGCYRLAVRRRSASGEAVFVTRPAVRSGGTLYFADATPFLCLSSIVFTIHRTDSDGGGGDTESASAAAAAATPPFVASTGGALAVAELTAPAKPLPLAGGERTVTLSRGGSLHVRRIVVEEDDEAAAAASPPSTVYVTVEGLRDLPAAAAAAPSLCVVLARGGSSSGGGDADEQTLPTLPPTKDPFYRETVQFDSVASTSAVLRFHVAARGERVGVAETTVAALAAAGEGGAVLRFLPERSNAAAVAAWVSAGGRLGAVACAARVEAAKETREADRERRAALACEAGTAEGGAADASPLMLQVTVAAAEGVPALNIGGRASSLYCVVHVNNREVARTDAAPATLAPAWGYTARVGFPRVAAGAGGRPAAFAEVRVVVRNDPLLTPADSDGFLGEAVFRVLPTAGAPAPRVLPLAHRAGNEGDLRFINKLLAARGASASAASPLGTLRVEVGCVAAAPPPPPPQVSAAPAAAATQRHAPLQSDASEAAAAAAAAASDGGASIPVTVNVASVEGLTHLADHDLVWVQLETSAGHRFASSAAPVRQGRAAFRQPAGVERVGASAFLGLTASVTVLSKGRGVVCGARGVPATSEAEGVGGYRTVSMAAETTPTATASPPPAVAVSMMFNSPVEQRPPSARPLLKTVCLRVASADGLTSADFSAECRPRAAVFEVGRGGTSGRHFSYPAPSTAAGAPPLLLPASLPVSSFASADDGSGGACALPCGQVVTEESVGFAPVWERGGLVVSRRLVGSSCVDEAPEFAEAEAEAEAGSARARRQQRIHRYVAVVWDRGVLVGHGLFSVDEDQFDAAGLDGDGAWAEAFVTVPLRPRDAEAADGRRARLAGNGSLGNLTIAVAAALRANVGVLACAVAWDVPHPARTAVRYSMQGRQDAAAATGTAAAAAAGGAGGGFGMLPGAVSTTASAFDVTTRGGFAFPDAEASTEAAVATPLEFSTYHGAATTLRVALHRAGGAGGRQLLAAGDACLALATEGVVRIELLAQLGGGGGGGSRRYGHVDVRFKWSVGGAADAASVGGAAVAALRSPLSRVERTPLTRTTDEAGVCWRGVRRAGFLGLVGGGGVVADGRDGYVVAAGSGEGDAITVRHEGGGEGGGGGDVSAGPVACYHAREGGSVGGAQEASVVVVVQGRSLADNAQHVFFTLRLEARAGAAGAGGGAEGVEVGCSRVVATARGGAATFDVGQTFSLPARARGDSHALRLRAFSAKTGGFIGEALIQPQQGGGSEGGVWVPLLPRPDVEEDVEVVQRNRGLGAVLVRFTEAGGGAGTGDSGGGDSRAEEAASSPAVAAAAAAARRKQQDDAEAEELAASASAAAASAANALCVSYLYHTNKSSSSGGGGVTAGADGAATCAMLPCGGHAVRSRGRIYSVGGAYGGGRAYPKYVAAYSVATGVWNHVVPRHASDHAAPRRCGHVTVAYKGAIYVTGGYGPGGFDRNLPGLKREAASAARRPTSSCASSRASSPSQRGAAAASPHFSSRLSSASSAATAWREPAAGVAASAGAAGVSPAAVAQARASGYHLSTFCFDPVGALPGEGAADGSKNRARSGVWRELTTTGSALDYRAGHAGAVVSNKLVLWGGWKVLVQEQVEVLPPAAAAPTAAPAAAAAGRRKESASHEKAASVYGNGAKAAAKRKHQADAWGGGGDNAADGAAVGSGNGNGSAAREVTRYTVIEHRRSDMVYLNLDTLEWKKVKQKGAVPCPRSEHSIVKVGLSLVMFGGAKERARDEGADDVHDAAAAAAAAAPPPPFADDSDDEDDDDDILSPSASRSAAHGAAGRRGAAAAAATRLDASIDVLDDVYTFDLSTKVWTAQACRGQRPSGRHGHAACLDPSHASMLVVGGWSNTLQPMHCVFQLLLDSYTWRKVSFWNCLPPKCRLGHSVVCLPAPSDQKPAAAAATAAAAAASDKAEDVEEQQPRTQPKVAPFQLLVSGGIVPAQRGVPPQAATVYLPKGGEPQGTLVLNFTPTDGRTAAEAAAAAASSPAAADGAAPRKAKAETPRSSLQAIEKVLEKKREVRREKKSQEQLDKIFDRIIMTGVSKVKKAEINAGKRDAEAEGAATRKLTREEMDGATNRLFYQPQLRQKKQEQAEEAAQHRKHEGRKKVGEAAQHAAVERLYYAAREKAELAEQVAREKAEAELQAMNMHKEKASLRQQLDMADRLYYQSYEGKRDAQYRHEKEQADRARQQNPPPVPAMSMHTWQGTVNRLYRPRVPLSGNVFDKCEDAPPAAAREAAQK